MAEKLKLPTLDELLDVGLKYRAGELTLDNLTKAPAKQAGTLSVPEKQQQPGASPVPVTDKGSDRPSVSDERRGFDPMLALFGIAAVLAVGIVLGNR